MPDPERAKPGRPHLDRDNQQWIFDYLVKETGLVYHWWSEGGGSGSGGIRSHAMISKQTGRQAQRVEAVAEAELAAGHRRTALGLYLTAAKQYMRAQHPIFELNAEKRFLYDGLQRCYALVRELSPYPIERIDISWEGAEVGGYFHRLPGVERAPLLFYVPGSDVTAESSPDPTGNLPHERGLHVFSFDGPGQGRSNMRGIALTADNYERAARAMLDALVARPEVDADRIVLYGGGMGGFWATRFAALDPRIKAAATKSSYASKYYVLNEDSPRYAQLFAFLTQARTEDELAGIMGQMDLTDTMHRLSSPFLMVTGEYDHRDPIEDVYDLFDRIEAPAELWVFADQFHRSRLPGGGDTVYSLMLDWLFDRLAGVPMQHAGQVLYLDNSSAGPNSPAVPRKRRWFEPG
jgi:pimeloyl-ACP methyl ester carboxylesterase